MRPLTMLSVLGLGVALLPVGCGAQEQPAPPPPAPAATAAPAEQPKRATREARLDGFGNLRGSGNQIYGFEMPVRTERRSEGVRGPTMYVDANEERLVRFFRSRGHRMIKQLSGWRIEHTDRTRRGHTGPESEHQALIDATQGPGPGWTLQMDRGVPIELAKPALIALIEAEQAEAAGDTPPSPGADAAAERPGEDGKPLEDLVGEPGAPTAKPRPTTGGARTVNLPQLRRQALERKVEGKRGKDLSSQIHDYVKANPERGFLD